MGTIEWVVLGVAAVLVGLALVRKFMRMKN
jgi:hypothetical protein